MSPSSDARRLSLLVGALFGLVGMGSSSAAIALPVMTRDLEISTGLSAWVISLYALTLAVATAVYGRVSDLVGVRRSLLVGVGLMTIGALAGAFAPSYGALLAARLVQGAGAAAVPTLGVAAVTARFTGRDRAMGLGRIAGVAAAVSCLGPLAGGAVEEDVRGVALGIATLMFLVGGGVGSAVVGGLGEVFGMAASLLLLATLPLAGLAGLAAMVRDARRTPVLS